MINAPTQQALLAIMVHAAMADGEKSQAERDFVRDLSLQLDEQGGAKQLAQAVQAALLGRLSAQQAAGQLQDPMHRQLAYEWATAVCHADGLCPRQKPRFCSSSKPICSWSAPSPKPLPTPKLWPKPLMPRRPPRHCTRQLPPPRWQPCPVHLPQPLRLLWTTPPSTAPSSTTPS